MKKPNEELKLFFLSRKSYPGLKKKLRNYYIRAFFMKKLKRINLFLFIYDSNEKAK
jgi:hypothetical protein